MLSDRLMPEPSLKHVTRLVRAAMKIEQDARKRQVLLYPRIASEQEESATKRLRLQ